MFLVFGPQSLNEYGRASITQRGMYLHRTNFWDDNVMKNVNKSIRSVSAFITRQNQPLDMSPHVSTGGLNSHAVSPWSRLRRIWEKMFSVSNAREHCWFPRHFAPAFTDTKLKCPSTITLPDTFCDYTYLFIHFTLKLLIPLKLMWTSNFIMFSQLWKFIFWSYWRLVDGYQRFEEASFLHFQGRSYMVSWPRRPQSVT